MPRCRRDAFALVVTLLILSLLLIISVSYLTSMTAEHQTADAYTASASAEQAARTGVDSATAMLAECFRDYPDSATVWDNQQTTNSGTPYNTAAIVGGTNNEGTSLYLRAVPMTSSQSGATVANPLPRGSLTAADGTPYASNDINGNNPGNPACQTFVLPLISGVPYGQPRLLSEKSKIWPNTDPNASSNLNYMNLGQSDPTKQNWTDLNTRRISGDIQGAIGSRPGWNGVGPEPARAYWVNLKGSNGLITGRYAFWIDDESFRANNSLLGSAANPPDNSSRPVSGSPASSRVEQPGDLTLLGPLAAAQTADAAVGRTLLDPAATASDITTIRQQSFPGNFFPDALAFTHAPTLSAPSPPTGGTPIPLTTGQTSTIDALRYLTTNQSSALNLSRHGSQRLNLNNTVSTVSPTLATVQYKSAIQTQVNQLVQTMEYHLPYFGDRFYRTSPNTLNDATQVPGSPYVGSYQVNSDGTPITDSTNSQIYYYKVAANLRDYVDNDCQPTMIGQGGVVMAGAPTTGFGDDSQTSATLNEIWAQGKESAPYIQEVAVRYRPTVTPNMNFQAYYAYNIFVDYYIEFWNMSDRDIYASQMNNPTIWVRDQQTWDTYYTYDSILPDPSSEPLLKNQSPIAMQIGLVSGVTDPSGGSVAGGVVFRAGTVTVVTTDPQCASYTYLEPTAKAGSGGKTITGKGNNPAVKLPIPTPPYGNNLNVFVCPVINGHRQYTGRIQTSNPSKTYADDVGIQLGKPFEGVSPYTSTTPFPGTEVSLVNNQGYFDVVRGAITKTGACGYNVYTVAGPSAKQISQSDFSYGSSMMGNVQDSGGGPLPGSETPTISQLGDPRTNNEQIKINVGLLTADGTRFMASTRTLGSPNYPDLAPDTMASAEAWPDYYKFPNATPPNSQSPTFASAPTVVAGSSATDVPLTSIGQLGDIFDPARVAGSDINFSHGGGRTFKIGQHDDLYSDNPQTNVYAAGVGGATGDYVSASTGWASWRLTDIFDVADPIELPGRININGIMRDNGAALLSTLQGFLFQPTTASGTSDAVVHGDPLLNPGSTQTPLNSSGYSQIIKQMQQRLDAVALSDGTPSRTVKPFFERGEFGEIGYSTAYPANNDPLFSASTSLTGINMGTVTDHSREELFRRLAQMICTKGNTFTAYVVGQSILQPMGTTAATADTAPKKIIGTQRMRVTFRLVPKAQSSTSGAFADFHPAYIVNQDGTLTQNTFDPTNASAKPAFNQSGTIGVIPRYAKPDRYDVQILQASSY